jgi:hypothetical protein
MLEAPLQRVNQTEASEILHLWNPVVICNNLDTRIIVIMGKPIYLSRAVVEFWPLGAGASVGIEIGDKIDEIVIKNMVRQVRRVVLQHKSVAVSRQ